jgi:hypothetical protein
VNLGLRWDLLTSPVEKSNRQTNFSLTDGLIHTASDEDRGPLTSNFYGGWAPRLGVAYSPDEGRTAVRGAFGISDYRDNFGANGGTLERNHPLFQQILLQSPTQFTPFRDGQLGRCHLLVYCQARACRSVVRYRLFCQPRAISVRQL